MINPIETVYNDYRFRSRLEARWAVFLDTLGLNYEYEKEGFDLGEFGRYLPDFWLPEQGAWIEIKGEEPNDFDIGRHCALAYFSNKPVYIFVGDIHPDILANFAHPAHQPKEMAYLEPCMVWYECRKCRQIILDADDTHNHNQCGGRLQKDSRRLLAAYKEARQARFEHQ